ncbi:hypothetical protein WP39_02015 [Streptomyces sp. 604F]|nr:hypothetical protein [Streptomyces sp. 604F]
MPGEEVERPPVQRSGGFRGRGRAGTSPRRGAGPRGTGTAPRRPTPRRAGRRRRNPRRRTDRPPSRGPAPVRPAARRCRTPCRGRRRRPGTRPGRPAGSARASGRGARRGEAGVEGVTGQLPGRAHAALGDLAEADALDVGAALLQRAEDAPLPDARAGRNPQGGCAVFVVGPCAPLPPRGLHGSSNPCPPVDFGLVCELSSGGGVLPVQVVNCPPHGML